MLKKNHHSNAYSMSLAIILAIFNAEITFSIVSAFGRYAVYSKQTNKTNKQTNKQRNED